MESEDNLVIASDLSEGSAAALRTAVAYFEAREMALFHAFDPPFKNMVDDKDAYLRQSQAQSVAQCREFLAGVLGTDEEEKIEIIAEAGEPATALAAYVVDHDVDMVVAGTLGRTGLLSVLMGNVAASILDEVPCDIFIVPGRRPG